MPEPLTLLQAAIMEAVRPTPAGRRDPVLALISRARARHDAQHGPHLMQDCTDPSCREITALLGPADPLAAHGCLHAAVVIDRGRRVWYPCRSHEGGVHNYAAWWPKCPGPWCRLPYEHHVAGTMHVIPGGRVEYHDATGVVEDHG